MAGAHSSLGCGRALGQQLAIPHWGNPAHCDHWGEQFPCDWGKRCDAVTCVAATIAAASVRPQWAVQDREVTVGCVR